MEKRATETSDAPGLAGKASHYAENAAQSRGGVVTDIPPVVSPLGRAVCRHPVELIYHWARFGFPVYAVEDVDDRDAWFFSNDLQEAAAIGFKWLDNQCALEQTSFVLHGKVVYGYIARGAKDDGDLDTCLYRREIWDAAGADMNEAATPEILTCVRKEIFKYFALRGGPFFLLDFSKPANVAAYFAEWAAWLDVG
ncbi:transposase [Cupriavidus sp. WKF15]|uniref:transposase n=1 Tax=Cupriavidus sp. WKF15 TaxID=3032282 RepID=UPI0023E2A8B2|nr:transposase [Cupriavidus sp. WKF15]WER46605.1 transposase [Cupriavidus sp. WKF15]